LVKETGIINYESEKARKINQTKLKGGESIMKWPYKLTVVLVIIAMVFVAGCSNNEKAMVNAVTAGDTAKVQSLLDKGVSPNLKTDDGKSILMLAAYLGKTDIAKLLIEKGADVNAKDNDGKTALMYAAEKGNIELAKLLLENGADINATDNSGKTALQIAQENNQTEMVEFLSNWGKAPSTEPSDSTSASKSTGNSTTTAAQTPVATSTQDTVASLNKQLTSLLFDFDKSNIRADQNKALDDNLAIVKANPNLYVILGAHADERGTRDYNLELSARRAAVVKEYLTNAGIAEDHFVVYAFGKDHPLKAGHDEASRSFNRRVDVLMWDTQLSGEQVLSETIK
jgi:outer membrane protein OmpA-like peptidoglycan-associated protein